MLGPSRKFELLGPVRHPLVVTGRTLTDEDLVRAAWDGDASALGALLERHGASLYATALSMLGNPTDAQDAVQDSVLTALGRIDQIREPGAVAGWLRAVVRNHCLMSVRTRRATPTSDVEATHFGSLDVEDAIDRVAVADWVWNALDRLPEDQAVAVVLRYFSRHTSYQEIAAVLGIPVGTVRSRLNQAKTRLAGDLLRTAARSHADHTEIAKARARWWRATVDELHDHGVGQLYAADCAPDVVVEEPATGYHVRGIDDHRRGVEDSVAAGVRMHTTDVWAGTGITIIEGTYLNPPDDPRHCPATHTEVRIHSGHTSRILLYYRPHGDVVGAG